ncbi:neprilysin-1-like [Haemaphysalis longicornis]
MGLATCIVMLFSCPLNQDAPMRYFKYTVLLDVTDDVDASAGSISRTTFLNYIGLRHILILAEHASTEFRNALLQLQNLTHGVRKDVDRWQECMELVDEFMAPVTGNLYVQHHFSLEAITEMEHMIQRLKYTLNDTFANTTWMDDQTRSAAAEKLEKMRSMIGYPEWLLNASVLERQYRFLPYLNVTTPFVNIWVEVKRNRQLIKLDSLRQAYNVDEILDVGPTSVNAYYDSTLNKMFLPAAQIQSLFYQQGLPWSLNYGGIGMVIGHEMVHGFDKEKHQYNGDGQKGNGWSNTSEEEFNEKAYCFVDQYANISVERVGLRISGNRTLDENIADNGGVRTAYKA